MLPRVASLLFFPQNVLQKTLSLVSHVLSPYTPPPPSPPPPPPLHYLLLFLGNDLNGHGSTFIRDDFPSFVFCASSSYNIQVSEAGCILTCSIRKTFLRVFFEDMNLYKESQDVYFFRDLNTCLPLLPENCLQTSLFFNM